MGQCEIYNALKEKPRLSTREIASIITEPISRVSLLLNKMVKRKEILSEQPTQKELERITKKYPNTIFGEKRVRVFFLNKKGASPLAYLFWMVVGFVLGCVLVGKLVCKYWCGCG